MGDEQLSNERIAELVYLLLQYQNKDGAMDLTVSESLYWALIELQKRRAAEAQVGAMEEDCLSEAATRRAAMIDLLDEWMTDDREGFMEEWQRAKKAMADGGVEFDDMPKCKMSKRARKLRKRIIAEAEAAFKNGDTLRNWALYDCVGYLDDAWKERSNESS